MGTGKGTLSRRPARAAASPLDATPATDNGNRAAAPGVIRRAWPMTSDGKRFVVDGMSDKNKKRLAAMMTDPELRKELDLPDDVAPAAAPAPAAVSGKAPTFNPERVCDQLILILGLGIVLLCDKTKIMEVETIAPYVVFDPDVRKELAPAVREAIEYNWPGLTDNANPNTRLALALVAAVQQNMQNVEQRKAARAPTSIN